jgi:WD40 repeat protein
MERASSSSGDTETPNTDVTRFWDAETREMKGGTIRTKDHSNEHILVFSPDAKRIITDNGEREARIWDVASGNPVGDLLRHKYTVYSASFSPDGKSVATWGGQTKPRVWDVETGEQLLELQTQFGDNRCQILFSPDGKYLAVIRGQNYSGYIFDARTGSIHGQQIPLAYPPVVFSPNSKELVTYGSYGGDSAYVWETETGRPLTTKIPHDGEIQSMSFNSDGTLLVTASADHTARIWEIGKQ